jgi:hypothetical protein
MNHRSSIKYHDSLEKKTSILITVTFITKVEASLSFFFIIFQVLVVPRPVPKVAAIESFVFRRRAALRLALALHKVFPLLAIILNHYHHVTWSRSCPCY